MRQNRVRLELLAISAQALGQFLPISAACTLETPQQLALELKVFRLQFSCPAAVFQHFFLFTNLAVQTDQFRGCGSANFGMR